MRTGRRIDELAGDANPVAGLAHAALEDVADTEFPADLFHVDCPALVGKGSSCGR